MHRNKYWGHSSTPANHSFGRQYVFQRYIFTRTTPPLSMSWDDQTFHYLLGPCHHHKHSNNRTVLVTVKTPKQHRVDLIVLSGGVRKHLRYLCYTWVFAVYVTLYFNSTTSQRQIIVLFTLLHLSDIFSYFSGYSFSYPSCLAILNLTFSETFLN